MNDPRPGASNSDSFWAPQDVDETSHELEEFYSEFFENNDKLKAEIIGHEILEGNVQTNFLEYKISKRYSYFYSLSRTLNKNYPKLNLDNEINFPSKKLFGNLDPETIDRRKVLLNAFLGLMCKKFKEFQIYEFLEFLEIRNTYLMAAKNPSNLQWLDKPVKTTSQEIEMIIKYLNLLNKNPENLISTFKDFEHFYFEARPRLNHEIATKMLIGQKKTKGLLQFCGKFDQDNDSHLTCSVGLALLHKLLDYEHNRDAELFITVFAKTNPKMISLLNLPAHIACKGQRPCKICALKIYDIYHKKNPNLAVSMILDEEAAVEEYEKWKNSSNSTVSSIKVEQYEASKEDNEQRIVNRQMTTKQKKEQDDTVLKDTPVDFDFKAIASLFKNEGIRWDPMRGNEEKVRCHHYKGVFVKVQVIMEQSSKMLFKYATDDFSWILGHKDSKDLETRPDDVCIKKIRYIASEVPLKYCVFIFETKAEINAATNTTSIISRPCDDYPYTLEENEILGRRIMRVVMKETTIPVTNEIRTNLKFYIKNLNEPSINLIKKDLIGESRDLIDSFLNLKKITANRKHSA